MKEGPAGSTVARQQLLMVAQTALLGGHPRVGLEDNIYLEKGKMAPSNAALVEKAGRIIEVLGDHVGAERCAANSRIASAPAIARGV